MPGTLLEHTAVVYALTAVVAAHVGVTFALAERTARGSIAVGAALLTSVAFRRRRLRGGRRAAADGARCSPA